MRNLSLSSNQDSFVKKEVLFSVLNHNSITAEIYGMALLIFFDQNTNFIQTSERLQRERQITLRWLHVEIAKTSSQYQPVDRKAVLAARL